jgi:hypothetical protein
MQSREFLEAIWPDKGFFCIASPFTPEGSTKAIFAHRVFGTVDEAVAYVANKRLEKDIFFGVLSLREEKVWNPQKKNYRTGELGAFEVRVHRNILAGKALFFDLDVGDEPEKYSSQAEALAAVKEFCSATGLPRPMVVSSGGGIHTYWLLDRTIDVDEWRVLAKQMKLLAGAKRLRVDPMRTTDISSVLRVAGTLNFKERDNPRKVRVLGTTKPITVEALTKTLKDALIRAGEEVPATSGIKGTPPPDFGMGSNLDRAYEEGPPVTIKALGKACGQVRRFAKRGGDVSEPEWYKMLQLIRFTENGNDWAHKLSKGTSSYSFEDTEAKIAQLEDKNVGPPMCEKIADVGDTSICKACPHFHRKTSPLVVARNLTSTPPPVVTSDVPGMPDIEIIEPPRPYAVSDEGGVVIQTEDDDGNIEFEQILYVPLRPVIRQRDTANQVEYVVWQTKLPRMSEPTFFSVPASDTYKSDQLNAHLANNGIYLLPAQSKKVFQFMVAYIQQLQKEYDASQTHNALGWQDDFQSFVLPDRAIHRDGRVTPASLTPNAESAARSLRQAGTLEKQVELLRFYEDPRYVQHQFFILCGLGSILFHMTGHAGVIVNATGKSGASKSTSLYTAASFWGDPEMTPLNGTQRGGTAKGKDNRMTTMGSLPFCVDEITTMKPEAIQELTMAATQPGPRIILNPNSTERATSGAPRSGIMLSTANTSIQGLLAYQNAAGTAGAMRAIEIQMRDLEVHTKEQADEYLRQLKGNYGHIGPLFAAHVAKHYDAVLERLIAKMKEVDRLGQIKASERFWSAGMSCGVLAGEIVREMGLLNYAAENVQNWAISRQLPEMRGVVVAEYDTPASVLTNYMETIAAQIIVVGEDDQSGLTYIKRPPVGSLLGHYDTDKHMLWLLKKGFKDYCQRVGANSVEIIRQLSDGSDPVIVHLERKRILGQGTDYAKGQSRCFGIKMNHKEMSGAADLHVVSSSNSEATAPAEERALSGEG